MSGLLSRGAWRSFVIKCNNLIRAQGAGRVSMAVVAAEFHFKHSWF